MKPADEGVAAGSGDVKGGKELASGTPEARNGLAGIPRLVNMDLSTARCREDGSLGSVPDRQSGPASVRERERSRGTAASMLESVSRTHDGPELRRFLQVVGQVCRHTDCGPDEPAGRR